MRASADTATSGAGGRHRSGWHAAGLVLVALLALVGAALTGAALNTPKPAHPPQPAGGAGQVDPPTDSDLTGDARPGVGLPRSAPVRVTIARIGVQAEVVTLGINPDGTVQVPPLDRAQLAGWYGRGPSPGEVGNAVLVGHVDSHLIGPAVFFRLGELHRGDLVQVTRQDRSVVEFRVDAVRSYPKTSFPTELVYGPADHAQLRLVTCGGTFDENQRSYRNNIIVLATRTA